MKKSVFLVLAMAACLLTGCGGKQISEKARSAQSAIDALPASYSEEAEDAYSNARILYNALTDEEKQDVNKEKLDALEKSREEAVKKPAEELNRKIRDLSTKIETNEEMQQTADALEDIYNDLTSLSPVSLKSVDHTDLFNKISDMSSHISFQLEYADEDFNRIQKAITNYNSAIDQLQTNPRDAYLDMIDVVKALREILFHDPGAAVKAAETFQGDCKAVADGAELTDAMIAHGTAFEKECNALQTIINDDLQAYLDTAKGLNDMMDKILEVEKNYQKD